MGQEMFDALAEYFPRHGFAGRVTALPEYGVVYVRNAKAGTASVLMWLNRIHIGDQSWVPQRTVHVDHTLPTSDQVGAGRLAEMLAGEAFRFSFVRHPLRRVESAYFNKLVTAPRYMGRIPLQGLLGLPTDPSGHLTPEEFVTALEAYDDPLAMDPHWRPQHLNLMHPLVDYDVVGHLENFATDIARITEAVGLPEVPTESRNKKPRRDAPFDEAQLRRLQRIYEADFDLYGY